VRASTWFLDARKICGTNKIDLGNFDNFTGVPSRRGQSRRDANSESKLAGIRRSHFVNAYVQIVFRNIVFDRLEYL
jgi:hypothetical protein